MKIPVNLIRKPGDAQTEIRSLCLQAQQMMAEHLQGDEAAATELDWIAWLLKANLVARAQDPIGMPEEAEELLRMVMQTTSMMFTCWPEEARIFVICQYSLLRGLKAPSRKQTMKFIGDFIKGLAAEDGWVVEPCDCGAPCCFIVNNATYREDQARQCRECPVGNGTLILLS